MIRLEVPAASDAGLVGPLAVSMQLVIGFETAWRFQVSFEKTVRKARPSLYCLYLGYPALREAVGDHWRAGSPPSKLTSDATTNIGLTVGHRY